MRTYFFLVAISTCVCFALSRWLSQIALERNWARRQGDGAEGNGVPRMGGVAVVTASVLTLLLLLVWDNDVTRHLTLKPQEGIGLLAAVLSVANSPRKLSAPSVNSGSISPRRVARAR